MMQRMWLIRAGREGRHFDTFMAQNLVAVDWRGAGDPMILSTPVEYRENLRSVCTDWTEVQLNVAASQFYRFVHEIHQGDKVLTYDGHTRTYIVGEIIGGATYIADVRRELSCRRSVRWGDSLPRDALSEENRSTLSALRTLFLLPNYDCVEIEQRLTQPAPPVPKHVAAMVMDRRNIDEHALERLKARLDQLNWKEMQELTAALLRSLGYRTQISPQGADRGKDIFASPDGFGFERPRIAVEVKHRRGQAVGAPEIRSFIGGRHRDDRGLYVSTGGFSREAHYEAERAPIPVALMTMDDLARAVIDNYESFDSMGKALLPLRRIYWPQ